MTFSRGSPLPFSMDLRTHLQHPCYSEMQSCIWRDTHLSGIINICDWLCRVHKLLFMTCGKVKWCSCYEKYSAVPKKAQQNDYVMQQSHFWVYTQKHEKQKHEQILAHLCYQKTATAMAAVTAVRCWQSRWACQRHVKANRQNRKHFPFQNSLSLVYYKIRGSHLEWVFPPQSQWWGTCLGVVLSCIPASWV